MIITMTPLRISFFGGGTDYPEHFGHHGGATLVTSIDQYTYVTVNHLTEFFDYRLRISYSQTELCREIETIKHPSVRESLRHLGLAGGVEIGVVSDLPARTGLGSSSSFTVGLLNALHAFRGEMVSREELAAEAVHVERNMIHERVGLQDQYSCALGGLLHLKFSGAGRVDVTPVTLSHARLAELQSRLLLFYTGLQRTAHEVLDEQLTRTTSGDNKANLVRMRAMVDEGMQTLVSDGSLEHFGALLHEGWCLKRQLSDKVSNAFIDDAYGRAKAAGAVGGKLLGAGGGGFLLLYVEPERHAAVRAALADLREVQFGFEDQGTRVVYYRPGKGRSVPRPALLAAG